MRDTSEVFTGYTVKKLNLVKEEVYYGEFFTQINGEKYLTYSMIFTIKNSFYDISLKVPLAESPKFKKDYNNILNSFETDDNYLFRKSNEINSIEVVDISKIKI
jgi:hypothetical protein